MATQSNAIFISENWIKKNTPLPANLDVSEIYPFYRVAQDLYVRDRCGDQLYDRLCMGLTSSTLTTDERALLVLIRPALAYYCIYEALPFLATKIKNIGINSTQDDKQINADSARVKELRKEVLDKAEYYMQRVQKYLCKNSSLYPEYNFNNDDVNPNTVTPYNCDLFIDPNYVDETFIKTYWRQ